MKTRLSVLALLSICASVVSACGENDPIKPVRTCVEKANVRWVPSRGGSYEAFDCQRYKVTCTEPLELYEAEPHKLLCRLPRTSP